MDIFNKSFSPKDDGFMKEISKIEKFGIIEEEEKKNKKQLNEQRRRKR